MRRYRSYLRNLPLIVTTVIHLYILMKASKSTLILPAVGAFALGLLVSSPDASSSQNQEPGVYTDLNPTTVFGWVEEGHRTIVNITREFVPGGASSLNAVCASITPEGYLESALGHWDCTTSKDCVITFSLSEKEIHVAPIEGDWDAAKSNDSLLVTVVPIVE